MDIFKAEKTGKRRKINASGSRSGGIPLRAATNIVVTPHWGDHSLFVEKGFDEISATGGHRILSPRPFGPEPKIWSVFSGYFRFLPGFAANARFCRFFPPVSRYFRVFPNDFQVDIWHFAGSTVHCNRSGCSIVFPIDTSPAVIQMLY